MPPRLCHIVLDVVIESLHIPRSTPQLTNEHREQGRPADVAIMGGIAVQYRAGIALAGREKYRVGVLYINLAGGLVRGTAIHPSLKPAQPVIRFSTV